MSTRILVATLLSLHIVHAAPLRQDTFTEALTVAKKLHQPVAVYIHGSSWHPASRIMAEKVWRNQAFATALKHPVILTHIDIKQNLDKETAKTEAKKYKGWKPVTTYPAVQVYGSDGHLLKSYSGRELRVLTSPASLADHLNHILEAAGKRDQLLASLTTARAEKNKKDELKILTSLIELPLNHEHKITEQLKNVDPADSTGWQARISFQNWEFVRHITGLIHGKKIDKALAETDKLLATSHHTPGQRALILGAKAKALAAQGKLADAWAATQEAYQADPTGANGKAILRYGTRIAGVPLREAFPANSKLGSQDVGTNLTRDHASFTMSSDSGDSPGTHPTLFKGNYSSNGFAFHTANEKGAHIIIDLKSSCEIKALRITNRAKLQERAATLSLWASTDQKSWTQLWTAGKAAPVWEILLDKPASARYLKVGLQADVSNFLHLRAVDVFGIR